MTYSVIEVHTISCDECDEEETEEISPEYDNMFECEGWFLADLKKEGWVYSEEHDMHFCPQCAKDPLIISEYGLKSNNDENNASLYLKE